MHFYICPYVGAAGKVLRINGQVTSKNKINMMSRNETKRKIAYVEDLIINHKYIYQMSLVNIRAMEDLFRISG